MEFWGILGGQITKYWGRSPQYSLISPLDSPQDSPEGILEGLQKLNVGAHPQGAQGPGVGAESANAGGVWGGRAPPLQSWGPKAP